MSTPRTSWIAPSALGVSLLALGLSVWTAGCREDTQSGAQQVVAQLPPAAEPAKPEVQPAAAHQPEPSKPEARGEQPKAAPGALSVKRLVVTTGIEQREPVKAEEISAGKPVYAFVELSNSAAQDHGIVVTFEKDGGPKVGHVELDVPANNSRWRTWGLTRMIRQPGEWTAVVRSRSGDELARTSFDVS